MAIKGIFYVFIAVQDLERSKRFYGDVLGWQLGTQESNVVGFAFGSGYLVIHADREGQPPAPKGGGMHVEVQVDDVTAEYQRLHGLGVALTELKDQPWGERNFSFSDPDGYVWFYGQSMRGPE